MNVNFVEFLRAISKEYNPDDAENTFSIIKDKIEKEFTEESYFIIPLYFDYEPNISYLCHKENYKIIVKDELKDFGESDNPSNPVILKMRANLYGTFTFDTETKYLSLAAKDAYFEILQDDFEFLKNLAIKQQKSLIKRHIEMLKDKNDFDHTMKYYSRSFVNSVHKDELDLMLQEIIDENIIE